MCPQIKSPLLCSHLLFEIVLSYAGTCRELPFCPVAGMGVPLRMPGGAGAYRDIRANMEQTSVRTGLDHCGWACRGTAESGCAHRRERYKYPVRRGVLAAIGVR
jgi:hypothetical protein